VSSLLVRAVLPGTKLFTFVKGFKVVDLPIFVRIYLQILQHARCIAKLLLSFLLETLLYLSSADIQNCPNATCPLCLIVLPTRVPHSTTIAALLASSPNLPGRNPIAQLQQTVQTVPNQNVTTRVV
jgi:hypothetical protein